MKRWICLLLAALLLLTPAMALEQPTDEELKISAPSAILMERSTGTVLYEKNADEHLSPASVTKIMTLLLIMEQLDSGQLDTSDIVTASAQASSMGGSQIWLKEGEQMSVDEMLKCIAVNSANDCAVAMAEHISGSEEAFTKRMNDRAKELGMGNTQFLNCTGLTDDPGHYTTARDIACMSRALLAHPRIRDYTTIWMDTVRDGRFGLANTNKLIRFYEGATGLKTGSTDSALYCLSATAERDGMELIAVVMHAPTSNDRFESAKVLLNYGFANYTLLPVYPDQALAPVEVLLGEQATVQPVTSRECAILVEKSQAGSVTTQLSLADSVEAPVEQGQKLGELQVYVDGQLRDTIDLVAAQPVERLSMGGIFKDLLGKLFMAG